MAKQTNRIISETFDELLNLLDGPSAEDLCVLLERLRRTPNLSDVRLGIDRVRSGYVRFETGESRQGYGTLEIYATDNDRANKPPLVGRDTAEQSKAGAPFSKRYFNDLARRSGCKFENPHWELFHPPQYSGSGSYGPHKFPYPDSHFSSATENILFIPTAMVVSDKGKKVPFKVYIRA